LFIFQSFSFAPQCWKKIIRKISRPETSLEQFRLRSGWRLLVGKKLAKEIENVRQLLAAQGIHLSLCAKNSSNQKL